MHRIIPFLAAGTIALSPTLLSASTYSLRNCTVSDSGGGVWSGKGTDSYDNDTVARFQAPPAKGKIRYRIKNEEVQLSTFDDVKKLWQGKGKSMNTVVFQFISIEFDSNSQHPTALLFQE